MLAQVLTKVAFKLIKQFGRKAVYYSVTQGDYNPDTGIDSIETQSEIIVFTDAYKTNDYKEGFIEAGDIPIYTTSEIKKNDKLQFGNEWYFITQVQKYFINDKTVLYVGNIRTRGA